jgi:hypothetical protein
VHCVLDTAQYPTGINYTNKDVDALPITRHDFHGEWNYTLGPPDTHHNNPKLFFREL